MWIWNVSLILSLLARLSSEIKECIVDECDTWMGGRGGQEMCMEFAWGNLLESDQWEDYEGTVEIALKWMLWKYSMLWGWENRISSWLLYQ
jgi:hypothetical protein